MSKAFKGKTCAYCGEPQSSTTCDHVVPREFFPKHLRGNLPKVPACKACNNAKSNDEHYLATVLPFGSDHPASRQMLERDVPRRLEKNRKLHRTLAESRTAVQLDECGSVARTFAVNIEPERFSRFARYLIRGLHTHLWEPIPKGTWVGAGMLAPAGSAEFCKWMQGNGDKRSGCYGDGLLSFEAVRSRESPSLSLWRLRLFGGVRLGGDPELPGFASSDLFGMVSTKPKREFFPD